MAARAYGAALEELEKSPFVPSYRIEGTPVHGADGKHIGKVEWLLIDKLTGKVEYAVISFPSRCICRTRLSSFPPPRRLHARIAPAGSATAGPRERRSSASRLSVTGSPLGQQWPT